MAEATIQNLNSQLDAAQKDAGRLEEVANKQKEASDALLANTATVLGDNVGQTVNGIQSLESKLSSTTDAVNSVASSTAGVLAQVTSDASIYPSTDPASLNVDVSAGTFTTTVTNILDSAGGSVLGTFDAVTSTGTDAASSINSIVSSLTGATPTDENLTIVSLGGASISELTGTVQEAAKRKNSLIGEIKSAAGASSTEGLGDGINDAFAEIEGAMNDVVNDVNGLTQQATKAVSAIENLGNEVANAAAEATNSIQGAIDQTIGQVTAAIETGFEDALGGLEDATNDLLGSVESALSTGLGFAQDIFEGITGNIGNTLQNIFPSSIAIGADVISSVMDDVVAGGDINLTNATKRLALLDDSLDPKVKQAIQETEASSPQEFQQKVEAKARAKGATEAQIAKFSETAKGIDSALTKVETTIAGQIVSEVGTFYTEDTDLAELIKRYVGADTKNFEFIDSKEELELELYRMTREVSEIVVHATETYTNSNIGSEEIHLRHKDAGHEKGIQYHLVIRRDGRLQRGMPLDQISDASNIRGHALNCIDVCLVGGVNVPTDEDNPLENLSSQSFTQAQMKTLEAVMEGFYHIVSGGQVIGHNNLSLLHEDPYFDVVSFVENKFGKKTVYSDLFTEPSLSRKELVSKKPI